MNEITQIQTITDEDAARFVRAEALSDLAELITSMPIRDDSRYARRRGRATARRVRSGPRRLRWPAALAFATMAAAAMLAVMTLGHAGSKVGPIDLGPTNAQALSFKKEGRYILVIVRNPYADPARYRAEFAANHLNIKLQMIPASPSLVGQVVFIGGSHLNQLKPITSDAAKCRTLGGSVCQVGVRVSTNYHGTADIGFGRATRPGEQYESSGSVTAPGEAMHGLDYKSKSVATVLAMLKARHVTVPQYRWNEPHRNYTKALAPSQVPPNWIVESALPWAPQQVLLFVQPKH